MVAGKEVRKDFLSDATIKNFLLLLFPLRPHQAISRGIKRAGKCSSSIYSNLQGGMETDRLISSASLIAARRIVQSPVL